jgi:predicted SAM-dependent methyltransferase
MNQTKYDPLKLFNQYRLEENNDVYKLLKFNILQLLGQQKNKIFKQENKYKNKDYLQLGCGSHLFDGWVNLDVHCKKSLISFSSDVIFRHDLRQKLPFPNDTFKGIFTEHCLEHLNPRESFNALKEAYRVLKKNGVLRVIVPDAEKYASYYMAKLNNLDTRSFGGYEDPRGEYGFNDWKIGAEALRGLSCYLGHYCLYDPQLLSEYLRFIGFKDVRRVKFSEGLNLELVRDAPEREWNSLYMEGIK